MRMCVRKCVSGSVGVGEAQLQELREECWQCA